MNQPPHMSSEEFRVRGKQFIDWIADYWDGVGERPVLSEAKPGDVFHAIGPSAPGAPGGAGEWDQIFADLERVIVPGITHWQHPRFFGYFPANASAPAVLGELLSAGLGVQGMLWLTSPACTELETRTLDWLADLIGLPARFASTGQGGGVIQGTASEAALVAMVAARDRARRHAGANGREFVVYASSQAHSSIVKAAMIAGIALEPDDRRGVRLIEVDGSFAIRADLLEEAIREDLGAGRVPCFVCATIGTTATTAVDDLQGVATAIARARESTPGCAPVWLHVDAAHSGSACICPEHRWMIEGVKEADSFCFNPHKWLLTNFDCNCFWIADRSSLVNALSVTPEYLRNPASDAGHVIDYRDWQIPLGRRFRALKLWFVLRHYGADGLREHIRKGIALAKRFETLVRNDARFEIVAERTVNLVCVRLRGTDEQNRHLLARLNASGRVFVTHAAIPTRSVSPGTPGEQRFVIRVAIGAIQTSEADVEEAWALFRTQAGEVLGSGA